jgi:RNA-splicing ligase RtcB
MGRASGRLAYFISHNIARNEIVDDRPAWVHRKGSTRAFPAGHHALKGTIYAGTIRPARGTRPATVGLRSCSPSIWRT